MFFTVESNFDFTHVWTYAVLPKKFLQKRGNVERILIAMKEYKIYSVPNYPYIQRII